MDDKTRDRIARFAPLAVMIAAIAAIYGSGANKYVSIHELRERHEVLKAFVADHWLISYLAYVLAFTVITATAVPGAVLLQFASGFLFGAVIGGTGTAIGATAGAMITYYVARSAFGDALRARVQKSGGLGQRLSEGLARNAFWYLLSIRIPPFMPFVLINALAGMAAVPVRAYVAATFLGVLPSSIVWSSVGQGLDRKFAHGEPLSVMDPYVLWPLAGLSLLSLLPVAVKTLQARRAKAA